MDSLHFGKQFKSTSGVNSLVRPVVALRFATLLVFCRFRELDATRTQNVNHFFLLKWLSDVTVSPKHNPIVLMASLNSAVGRSRAVHGNRIQSNGKMRRSEQATANNIDVALYGRAARGHKRTRSARIRRINNNVESGSKRCQSINPPENKML